VKPHSIFLSHAYDDLSLARQYAIGLKQHGYNVWIDETGLQAGVHMSAEITTQLNSRTALVVLWTPASSQRPNVASECKYFLGSLPDRPYKRFIPVHAVDCAIRADLTLGVTYEQIMQDWNPGQYFYVDGRYRPVAETVQDIVRKLEEPISVPPPFRLDAMTEQGLIEKIKILFANSFGYSFPQVERQLTDISTGISGRLDLITIRADTILGGGDTIIIEVKRAGPLQLVGIDAAHQVERYMRLANAQIGWLMTTGRFHAEVVSYCKEHAQVRLFDRELLLAIFRQNGFRVITDSEPEP
jgi:TIR domain/Restriction endonuclease